MRFALTGLFLAVPLLAQADEAKPVDFAHDVLPILTEHCAKCHTNGTYKGSFSLDTRAILLDAGVVEPGDAAASDLIDRLVSDETDYKMPPEGPRLSEEEVGTLRRWIDADLPWEAGFTFRKSEDGVPLKLQAVEIPAATETAGEHPIDRLLEAYAPAHDVTLPPVADDATFLRRLHLDVLGLLPSEAEQTAFLADTNPYKRPMAVAAALARDRDYAAHWMTFWNDLLRNDYAGTGFIDGGRKQITKWLYESLRSNQHYDEFVRELIAPQPESEGFAKGIIWRGRVNASQVPPLQFSQNVGQVFLGINLKCASCHDSFIDDWKLADAYGLAAVVTDEPLELHRCDIPTGRTAEAKFVFPELGTIDASLPRDARQQRLAELMTHADNGRLPRTIVNRIWRQLMGRGLVEPVDSMASPAWSPELLDYLAGYLVENDYDVKKLIAHIATSTAYQSETVALAEEPTPEGFVYTGPIARRMTAEQFVDALWTLTGTGPAKANADVGVGDLAEKQRPKGEEQKAKGAEQKAEDGNGPEPQKPTSVLGPPTSDLTDGVAGPNVRAAFVVSDPLMRSLGRPNREQVVTTRPDQLTTLQALDLSNGPILSDLLEKGAEKLIEDRGSKIEDRPANTALDPQSAIPNPQSEDLVTRIFRTALSRDPSPEEHKLALELAGLPPTKEGVTDLLWAIVLLPEFQHVK